MIQIVYGDLLKSDCHVIAQNCNCFSTMGAGIAKQIAKKYPGAYEADKSYPGKPKERLGKYSFWSNGKMAVFNLYGQYEYGTDKVNFDYKAFGYALMGMMQHVDRVEKETGRTLKIGLPHGVGAVLAGGDWIKIEKIIMKIATKFNKTIHLYMLDK